MLSKEVDQDISNSQEPFFVWVCFVLFCFAHERVLIFFWEGGGGGGVVIILGQILEHSICFMYHFNYLNVFHV